MTKSEAAAAQARCDSVAASDALSTNAFGADDWEALRMALADRAALIEALRPFALEWDTEFIDAVDLGPVSEKANLLLRSLGEITDL